MTALDEQGFEPGGGDVETVTGALAPFTGEVCRDRVLAITRRRGAGHVYNLGALAMAGEGANGL